MSKTKLSERIPGRVWAPALAWLGYLAAFPLLQPLLDTHTGVTAFVPVLVTGWCCGKILGGVAGVATLPVTAVLAGLLGGDGEWLSSAALLGSGTMVGVGAAVGYMRELNTRYEAEIEARREVERSLHERDERLALVNTIARRILSGESVDELLRLVVDGLHDAFPEFRAAYSTVAPDGAIVIVHASGPNELSWPENTATGLSLPAAVVAGLRDHDLIAVADVETDPRTQAIAAALAEGNARALLDAPVPHASEMTGLLSFDSPIPREWTEPERTTLRDVADVLTIALGHAQGKQALEQSEQRFRTLAESTRIGIALLQEEGAIYTNPALQELSGYSGDELRHLSLFDLLHPEDVGRIKGYRRERLSGREAPTRYETRLITKSRVEKWLEVTTSTFMLNGKATILTTSLDVTDRKRAEQDIRESEGRFRVLLEHYFDGIAVIVDGAYVYVNPTLCRMSGYTANELLGRDPIALLDPDQRSRARDRLQELAAGAPEYPSEYRGRRKDGLSFPLEAITRRITYDGQPALLRTFRDLTARKRAEAAVLESDARSRRLLESYADGIAVFTEGRLRYVNPALCNLLGYEASDLLTSEADTFLVPADRVRAMARGARTGTEEPETAEFEALRKDGTLVPIEVTTRPSEYAGQPAMLAIVRDLSHRKQAEQAVQEAESKYRAVVEHSLAGVYVVQDGRYAYVNQTYADIFRSTQTEFLAGDTYPAHVIDEDLPVVREQFRRLLDGEVESTTYVVRARRKDDQLIHVEARGALTTIDGRPAVVGTLIDISERMRAEQALRTSEERFRAVFEQSPFGILALDGNQRITRANDALCATLGYDEAELLMMTPSQITHPDDRATIVASRATTESGRTYSTEKRYLRKSGETVFAATSIAPVFDADGEQLCTIVMIEDITERLELDKQLRQAHRLESVGQLAGGVAHNFNNALTAIFGYSELLARRFEAEDPALKDLEQIQRVAEQSAALTRQLLIFSRKDAVRPSVFCLNEAVESSRDLLSPLIGDEVRMRFRLDRAAGRVRADRSQMEQVITNLVLNARDAMPEGGAVTVETKGLTLDEAFARTHPEIPPGRYVALTVTDTGTGIDHATAARVFEPFFTTKEPGEGVGLGLAMVHGAVKQCGGVVTVDSEPGSGSTFTLYVPVFEESARPTATGLDQAADAEPTTH